MTTTSTLQAAAATDIQAAQPATQSTGQPAALLPVATARNGVRVLLVEDDDATRIAIAYILESSGMTVAQTSNGIEAVAHVKEHAVDAIVLDIQMPSMDGLRALALIRRLANAATIPIIILTAHASVQNVKAATQAGATAFIVKRGFTPQLLVTKINKLARGEASAEGLKPGETLVANGASGETGAAPNPLALNAGPGAPPTKPFDVNAWKLKAQTLGRLDRDGLRASLESVSLPVVLPALLDDIRAADVAAGGTPAEFLALVEQSAAASVAIIGAANRNQTTSKGRVNDLEPATRWLGQMGVGKILDDLAARTREAAPHAPAIPLMHRWWRHSVAVSAIAGEIAIAFDVEPALARLGGLIHDVGRLLLYQSPLAERILTCYDLARNTIFPITMAEQILLSQSHKQIGQDYCHQQGLTPLLTSVCVNHDIDDALINKLDNEQMPLAITIHAANQIAKAAGLGSLVSDDLLPLPAPAASAVRELELQIRQAVDQTRKIAAFRVSDLPAGEAVSLPGVTVAFLSPQCGVWNPFQHVLTSAGATVTGYEDAKMILSAPPMADVLIIDYTSTSFTTALPMLRRLCAVPALAQVPKLLLARRSEDPELVMGQSGIAIKTYATPIRGGTLIHAVRQLFNG